MKFELKMISATDILHSDHLKPFISRRSHVSDDNFPKEARSNFLPKVVRLQKTAAILYQKVFHD